ncbi:hypothetical protein TNCV_2021721 [Trichonephila clavipes]|nr:hypothetical protein TNCV_2021721 [Trichonephila clavipes]
MMGKEGWLFIVTKFSSHSAPTGDWWSLEVTPACWGTATTGSDVVQSGRQFSMTFSNICGRISAITRECCLPNGQAFVAYPYRPMTLHSPKENSLAVLNYKILEGQLTGPKREIRRSPNVSFE